MAVLNFKAIILERFASNGSECRFYRRRRYSRDEDVDQALLRMLQNCSGRFERVLPEVRKSNFETSVRHSQRGRNHENSHFRLTILRGEKSCHQLEIAKEH